VTDFYGERDEVRSILLQCCFDTEIRTYEVKEAILALTNPRLYDESDIGKFMEYFADEMDSDIRYALYCDILEYRLWESTIDFVLKGIEKLNPNNGVNASERLRLKELLKKLDSLLEQLLSPPSPFYSLVCCGSQTKKHALSGTSTNQAKSMHYLY